MGGGGHHHAPIPKVPDYKIYKVEDIPELMQTKKALAAVGLKDPWLRNEVWKYMPGNRPTNWQVFRQTIGRGMLPGFVLAVITTVGVKLFGDDDHHDHGEGHH